MEDLRRNVSWSLKTIWTFFPSILFLLLTINAFWGLGQGRYIIIAITEKNANSHYTSSLTRIYFLPAVSFWVYITWYSSRIIAYVNDRRLANYINDLQHIYGYSADDSLITLYKDPAEWAMDSLHLQAHLKNEPPYSMNWFMSDTTRNRIIDRLNHKPMVEHLISHMQRYP